MPTGQYTAADLSQSAPQQTGAYSQADLAPQQDFSRLTANPNGEGTYAMWNAQGQKIPVPYDQVQQAAQQGYKFDTNPNQEGLTPAQQFQKDYNFATTGPGNEAAFAQSDRNAPLPQQAISGMVKGIGTIGKPVMDVVGRMGGVPQSAIESSLQAQTPMEMAGKGAMVAAALAPAAVTAPVTTAAGLVGGGVGARAGHVIGQAAGASPEATALLEDAGGIAGGIAGGYAGSRLSSALAPKPVAGQNYNSAQAAAFEGAVAPAASMGKNFIPQEVTPQALTPIRATAARMMNGNPLEQATVRAAVSPSTPPLQRLQAYQGVVQASLNDLEQLHSSALNSAADVPADTSSLVKGLQSHISATTDPADVAAIRGLIQRTQQIRTLDDLNTFRQELNNETSPEYRQSQIQAGRSGTSVQAASDLAGNVRSQYYEQLGDATGVNYAPLKMRESNLLTTLESLQNQRPVLAKAEATFNAPSTLKETAGNLAGIIQNPRTGITQTVLRESPAFRVSNLLQKSLADLPGAPPSYPRLGSGAIEMQAPGTGQSNPTVQAPYSPTTRAQRLGLLLKAPPIELPGAVQQNIPAYSPDTAAARLGRLLPAQSAAPIQLPQSSALQDLMLLRNGDQ